jgi:hypothetical protein
MIEDDLNCWIARTALRPNVQRISGYLTVALTQNKPKA